MNKIVRNVIIGVLLGIIAIITIYLTYYTAVMKSQDNKMANIIGLGNDCMNNSDYLGAIENYRQALDFEPENREIKNAIAHAYVMQAGTLGDSMEAIENYRQALDFNDKNSNAYWGIVNVYESLGDEDNELLALQSGYLALGDENMKIKADNIEIIRAQIKAEEEARAREEAERLAIEEAHNDLLMKVMALFEGDEPDIDAIKEMIRGDEFIQLTDEIVSKETSYYYGDRDESGKRSGKGIAVYADGYYYYGDFYDDERSGKGIYIRAAYPESSSLGSYIYDGMWENDMPNGDGTATSNYYPDKIDSQSFKKQVIEGSYTKGLENGKMTLTGTTKGGRTSKYVYTSVEGIAEQSSDEDSGVRGQYIIAVSKDGQSNLTSDGSKRGVEGFIE